MWDAGPMPISDEGEWLAPEEPEPEPVVPMGLLGRPDGPILPEMPLEDVEIGVGLANAELEANGYAPSVVPVTVYQGTVDEVSFYARKEGSLGWTPGKVVFVGQGELCGSPDGYDGRLLVWVLTHELLHTVGFEHGDQMKALTDALGERCDLYCEHLTPDP